MPAMKQKTDGYTLIELAVAVIIIGLIVTPFGPLYATYRKNVELETTKTSVAAVANAIGNFRTLYGRYPCPASLELPREHADYGREMNNGDCGPTAPTMPGTEIKTSLRTMNIPDPANPTGPLIPYTPRIRIGAVPFRQLNLEESDSFDAYHNRLVYIVTEGLAVDSTFELDRGGITILNDADQSAVTPADSAHFMVISHGPDGLGAYTQNGTISKACPTGQAQSGNCTLTGNPAYKIAQRNDSDGPAKFDDVVNYFAQDDMPLWQYSSATGAELHIHQKSLPGNVGVRAAPTTTLSYTTDVGGNLRSNARLRTQEFCKPGGDPADCFDANLIGGDTATGGGLKCPDDDPDGVGKFMVGIFNGPPITPICEDEVIVRCDPGTVLSGIDANGNKICSNPPDPCPVTAVTLCGTGLSLPAASNGTLHTLTAGVSLSRTYHCQNGTWQLQSSSGVCTCTPTTQTSSPGCASGFTGTFKQERTLACPAGTWSGWVTIEDTCTCTPTTETRSLACKSFETGSITEKRTNTCPSGAWGPWTQTGNTCTCNPKTETRSVACAGGLSGTIKESRTLACPSGNWSAWSKVSDDCTCLAKTETRSVDCEKGKTGSITEEREFKCPAAKWSDWTQTASTCKPVPVITCKVSSSGSGVKQAFGIGNETGSTCTCGSAPASCHSRLGASDYINYTGCTCD